MSNSVAGFSAGVSCPSECSACQVSGLMCHTCIRFNIVRYGPTDQKVRNDYWREGGNTAGR